MRRYASSALVIALFGLAIAADNSDKDEAVKSDLAKLQGTWNLTYSETRGMAGPEKEYKRVKFIIKGDKLTVVQPKGERDLPQTIILDPTKDPKKIDLVKVFEGGQITKDNKIRKTTSTEKLLGIYAVSDDQIKLCLAPQGSKRPSGFETARDNNYAFLKLERQASASGVFLKDDFKGDNGTLLTAHRMEKGSGWVEYGAGSWQLREGRAWITAQGPQDVIAADAGKADGTLTCEMFTPAGDVTGLDAGLITRMVDNDNYWLIAFYADDMQVYKKVNGGYTNLAKVPVAFRPAMTYRMKVTVKGNTLTTFVDGVQKMQVTMDAFPTATKFGLRDNSAAGRQPGWDKFQVSAK
jgi:uncharacterized protein (TIGR03067 family)